MPNLGWVTTTVVDLHGEPDERSERVSQLTIFTGVEVLETLPGWYQVRGPDGYVGWIREMQIRLEELPPAIWKVRTPWVQVRKSKAPGILGVLPFDARFYGEARGQHVWVNWPNGQRGWVAREALCPAGWKGSPRDLARIAQEFVGIPYLWGGTTSFGFDCSGLVQRLFHFVFNVWLPRDSRDQQSAGERISEIFALRVGDILCFPGHVAIYFQKGKIIHASGRFSQVVVTELFTNEPYSQELREKFLFGVRTFAKYRNKVYDQVRG